MLTMLDKSSNNVVDKILGSYKLGLCFSVVVNGYSMYPCLTPGDVVKVVSVNPYMVKTNDIIVYKKFESHLTVHRIIDKVMQNGELIGFLTKGDYNEHADDYHVPLSQLLGVVVKTSPNK